MTTISGQIAAYIEQLGGEHDSAGVRALMQASSRFRKSEPVIDPETGSSIVVVASPQDGVTLNFHDEVLRKVTLDVRAAAPGGLVDPETTISGADLRALSKDAVVERWGAPTAKGKRSLQYAMEGYDLTFSYLRDQLVSVTVRQIP